ncbi:MAG: alpha-L-rhamnosidase C-terminal domain-containing protein, partial [Aristaeellaceae bacterium]
VWEHWDGLKPDGTMWSPDMNSFNHYAYGAIGEWLYRVVAGIEIDEAIPGYKHAILAPCPGGNLAWASGSYESVYGTVSTAWALQQDAVTLTVRVPFNTTASIILEEGAKAPEGPLAFRPNDRGRLEALAGSGTWTVTYTR